MSTRIEQLARPKPNLLKYPDRRSVYWLDELPLESTGSTTAFVLSPRWSQLCQSKHLHPNFQQNRQSPMWPVTPLALRASASDRVCYLALPRSPTDGWQPDRPLLVEVSKAVCTAVPSARIWQLSQPKCVPTSPLVHKPLPSRMQLLSDSPRKQLLSMPKCDHAEYRPNRPVYWTVPLAALRATASSRIQALSLPRQQGALCEQRDPYRVSRVACCATASQRILELSTPLPRRCHRK